MHTRRKDDFLSAEKRREQPMPSCLLLESLIQDLVYKGDNHHEDPMTLFLLTSSRLDSIRTLQHLNGCNVLLIIADVKGGA
jgi:hypothetical protein